MAPLEGVSDTVFRQIIVSTAKPDLFFTEFTSADGLLSRGSDAVSENLLFSPPEAPIIAQIWGNNPDVMYEAAKLVAGRGFAGIDINMGCPDKTVMKNGCGASLIDTPETAASVIRAVKNGIRDAGTTLPVSVKTRLGTRSRVTDTWIPFLLGQEIDALTVHGRTAREMSNVPAHWDDIGRAVRIRDRMGVRTNIIGNGDIRDARRALEMYGRYQVDGVMIGRGIFQNLWAFDRSPAPHQGTPRELIRIMERHVTLFAETWGSRKSYAILKKFYKLYIHGFHGASDWRVRFMATTTPAEALALLSELSSEL